MSPFRVPSAKRKRDWENGIEQERAQPGGSNGAGEGAQLASARSGGVAGAQLSASETDPGPVSSGRSEGTAAWEPRSGVEPGLHGEVPNRSVILGNRATETCALLAFLQHGEATTQGTFLLWYDKDEYM